LTVFDVEFLLMLLRHPARVISKLWLESGEMDRRRSALFTVSKPQAPSRRRSSSDSKRGVVDQDKADMMLMLFFPTRCQKQNLSACVVDDAQDTERHFSLDSLRQLFKFNETTNSDTHDTFKCKRCKDGRQLIKAPALLYGDASR
jgi:hypothetical protein